MKLLKKFESYMSREEMCSYLCKNGYKMDELEMCSNSELAEMCRKSELENSELNNENMNSMSRDEMYDHLCKCGHKMEELEMCSNSELAEMCRLSNNNNNYASVKEHQETQNYMFFSNLETIKRLVDEILEMDKESLDKVIDKHDWASDHISVAAENIEHVFNFVVNHDEPNDLTVHQHSPEDEEHHDDSEINVDDEHFAQRESLKRFNNF